MHHPTLFWHRADRRPVGQPRSARSAARATDRLRRISRIAAMEGLERHLRTWTALIWLVPTAVALQGAWQGRSASGRRVGRPFAELSPRYLAGLVAPYLWLLVRLWRPLPLRLPRTTATLASGAGALLSLLGMGFILWGRLALGRMYNVSSAFGTQLYADPVLVTAGPFGRVRHPMYLGALVAGVGGVLLYRTWTALLILAHEAVFWVRAGKEEQALAAEFGGAWWAYARRVPAGIPVLGAPSLPPPAVHVDEARNAPAAADIGGAAGGAIHARA